MKKNIFCLLVTASVLIFYSCLSSGSYVDNNTTNDTIQLNTEEENPVFEEVEVFVYTLSDNGIILNGFVTRYRHRDRGIVIPAEINGYPVVEIGANAFRGEDISSVELPETIRIIHEEAFSRNRISELILPNSIEIIYDNAFSYNGMKELVLSNNLEIIGGWAFDGNFLEGDLIIPEGVKIIGRSAFSRNRYTSVVLPNSLQSLGSEAFRQMITIDTVVIGDNVNIEGDPFPNGYFGNVYEQNNKRGGIYILTRTSSSNIRYVRQ